MVNEKNKNMISRMVGNRVVFLQKAGRFHVSTVKLKDELRQLSKLITGTAGGGATGSTPVTH